MSGALDGDDAVLVTKGCLSTVYAYNDAGEPAGRHGRYGAGHVAPFDHDEHRTPTGIPGLFEEENVGGPSVVLESSDGAFHTWNLAVRTHPRTSLALERGDDDTKHEGVGRRRGYWRLRTGPKLHRNGDDYKPAPEYRGAFSVASDADGTEPDVSEPHVDLLAKMLPDKSGRAVRATAEAYVDGSGAAFVGDALETVCYTTFTDTGKILQRASTAPPREREG